MSLTSALSNALTGLTATARATDLVSSNVANAMTEGYARRELTLSPREFGGTGGGVHVGGVQRIVDQAVLNDKRLADAAVADAGLRSNFHKRIEGLLGDPGQPTSLSGRIGALNTAFVEAASRPDSEARLAGVLSAAANLTTMFHSVSDEISAARTDADRAIARDVDFANTTLARLDDLNTQIVRQTAIGRDASSLMDQRQAMVDALGKVIPLVEVTRDHNKIALMSRNGAMLLDDSAAVLGFTPTPLVTSGMSLQGGPLSGLTLNGVDMPMKSPGLLAGGSLSAAFQVRDEMAPIAQTQIDALARDLVARFANPAVDLTLTAGAPGLFTDAGGALNPASELGLAGRIEVNALADPARGGELWRLRAGLGAADAGDVANAKLFNSLQAALAKPTVPASGQFLGAARSMAGLSADFLSQVSSNRLAADSDASYASARQTSLTGLHLANGVDTDAEMEKLLQIERAYAANARVIQSVDDMLAEILRI